MIRINLLPHRVIRRERRKKAFVFVSGLAGAAGGTIALLVALGIQAQIDMQTDRNNFIKRENAKLDQQIKEIATLKQEIEALRARQEAVETLQRDRTLPVHLLDELVKLTPEGIQLKQIRQQGNRVNVNGVAQSNERISSLLRSLAHDTPWLERPELLEIKAVVLGKPDPRSKDVARRAYQFSISVSVKAKGAEQAGGTDKTAAGGTKVSASAGARR